MSDFSGLVSSACALASAAAIVPIDSLELCTINLQAEHIFDLDLVAMAIAAGLAPALGRQAATTIVLGFFNQWVAAVGHADADSAQNYFFAMGLVGSDNKRPHEIWVTNGTIEQIMSDLRNAHSVIAVNITDIIARLRTKSRTAGIDLSQPFFFPPEHERFSQIITEFEQEREARIARLRRSKKKMRRHQALMSRPDIKAVARLSDASIQPNA
jgi:hypothetical protein